MRSIVTMLVMGMALADSGRARPHVVRAPTPTHAAPNIVFILTDDLATNLVSYMPNVLAMQAEGTTFANYFVTDSLCCPSRSSIFTGKLPHNTGVLTNQGPHGGLQAFVANGNETQTFADGLDGVGYRSGLMGKFLNGYDPGTMPPSPGWREWYVAGNGYPEFDYNLNMNGAVRHFGAAEADYLTDNLDRLAVAFVAGEQPFFLEVATFAPHAPYVPAPRDVGRFPNVLAPRSKAFAARPDANAPRWLQAIPPLTQSDIATIDADFRKRVESVQAVDRLIGDVRSRIAELNLTNTYLVFSSDNGLHMGEHSLRPGKQTAFDTDIHVPLVVVGPGVPKGRVVDALVENVDLCPTFAELGGAAAPNTSDGQSLVTWLFGGTPALWRDAVLIEHTGPGTDPGDPDAAVNESGNPPSYRALRFAGSTYVEYVNGDSEYYDLTRDPDELSNAYGKLDAAERARLHAALVAYASCKGSKSCAEAATVRARR
jgi:arylsulfatase A-like enzyme